MITSKEAESIIFSNLRDFGTEEIPLSSCTGRVLAEEIRADRDFPPFDRVTMDGIAIRFEDWQKGNRTFTLVGVAPAGKAQTINTNADHCIEVMTGAILPLYTDTVIRYEDLEISGGKAKILPVEIRYQQNVHHIASDRKKFELLIPKGVLICATEIAIAASVGKSRLQVVRNPQILIISTGDELVEIDETPLTHQIRRSNVYAIQSLLSGLRITTSNAHLPDEPGRMEKDIKTFLKNFDVLVFSGAVSEGKFDFLPQILRTSGVQMLFHKVKQRPGKPFWFGAKTNGPVIFALPGNPVSSFVCTLKYLLPWLRSCMGLLKNTSGTAVLDKDIIFEKDLQYFIPIRLMNNDSILKAIPIENHGSGDFVSLLEADAFMELPAEKSSFKQGESYPFYPFR